MFSFLFQKVMNTKFKLIFIFVFLFIILANAKAAPLKNVWGNKDTVTYLISNNPPEMNRTDVQEVIAKAFKTYSAHIPKLTFTEIENDRHADIEVGFWSGDHGDGVFFNGSDGAHGIPYKIVHFNYDIYWTANIPGKPYNNETNDLYNSALFAIGQMFGLNNSKDKKSVMVDEYIPPTDSEGNYVPKTLSQKDIENLQNQPKTFTIFEDEYQQGSSYAFILYDDDSCHELTRFNNIASSINTNGHCIELFEDSVCESKSVMIKPGCTDTSCCSQHSFEKCKFNNLASSYRTCKSTGINILIWISVVISALFVGFLIVGIVAPWMFEGLKVMVKKLKRKRYALQALLYPPAGNKKIAISQLKFIGIIGKGNSANVRLAHFYSDLNDSNFMDVAVKTVKLHVSFSAVQKEIEIMEECDHPNIVKFVGWLQEGSYTHIVTEFMHGGNLHNYLLNDKHSPTIGQLFSYILQILDGMIYLGQVHILHRDLAARNCLLNSTHECLKISDFGLSRKTDHNYEYVLQNDSELPFRWLPLEAFCGKESYSTKADVWAFGVVMWEIFERGRVPYKGMNVNGVADFIKSGKRLEQPFYCSNEIYSMMLSCWDNEPKKRPEFETLKIHIKSIMNRVQPDLLPDSEYKNYYETPVKICKD